ncbi:MAG: E3 binding domain-containing protein, partial [Anaerolineales bacterium]|nr:E3 binding domain-containing protein [Anaerolineales bacterium]
MRQEIIMPRMGQSMDEGRVLQWLINIGDEIKAGQFIAEIETDKAVVEIESFFSGTLVEIAAGEGELVPTGAVIAFIEDGQPEIMSDAKSEPAPIEKPAPIQAAAPMRPPQSQPAIAINASPVAKRLAKEHNINLALVQGSGPGGRIGKDD